MTIYKYKAKSGMDFIVPGIGASVDGILEVDYEIEAPSLELVDQVTPLVATPIEAAQIAAPGAVLGVAPQATVSPEVITIGEIN